MPIWSSDGERATFRGRGGIQWMPADGSAQAEILDGPYTLDLKGHQHEDVPPDGRFLMVGNSDDFQIVIVQNWAAELARLVR